MPLQINRTDAKISVETTQSRLEIESRKARLELRSRKAGLDMHTELPRVVIDQYECFASAGLMGPIDLTRQAAQEAKQNALDFTSKISSEGELLAAIENKANPMAEIAMQNGTTAHEFGLDYIPKARPKITIVGGEVEINSPGNPLGATNGVEGEIIPAAMKIEYTPSQVKIAVERYASIEMRYVNSQINVLT